MEPVVAAADIAAEGGSLGSTMGRADDGDGPESPGPASGRRPWPQTALQQRTAQLGATPEHSAHGGNHYQPGGGDHKDPSARRGGAYRTAVLDLKRVSTAMAPSDYDGSAHEGSASRSLNRMSSFAAGAEGSGRGLNSALLHRSMSAAKMGERQSGDGSFAGGERYLERQSSVAMTSRAKESMLRSQHVAAMFEEQPKPQSKSKRKGGSKIQPRKNTTYESIRARLNWQNGVRLAIQHARDHPELKLADRSVHGGKSRGKKILSFVDAVKQHATASGKHYEGSLHKSTPSRSKMLKDVSHHHTAANAIPKVSGDWSRVDEQGRKVKSPEALAMPPWMIHPFHPYYRIFLYMTVALAALTGFVTPWVVAFQSSPGLCPYKDFPAFFEYIAALVFAIDITLSFFRCYYDQEVLITDRWLVIKHYLKLRFWVDIIAWLPFDYVIIEIAFPPCYASNTARWWSLLKILRLLRLYRVMVFFRVLEYNLSVGLLISTIVRNTVYAMYVVHWVACSFYFIARQENLTSNSWLGAFPALLAAWPTKFDSYVFSLYWAVTTFATVGYGDFHAASMPEAIFCLCFMFINVGITAYILGTITMVVIKNDERTGRFRDRSGNIKAYSKVNHLPKALHNSMLEHLRLHFNNEEASDEQVLAIYPSTIRRRILRHLYQSQLQRCYLFADCKQKFLDAVLAAARVELFMPQVEILTEGDHVNELLVVVSGLVELRRPTEWLGPKKSMDEESLTLNTDGASVHLGSRRIMGDGDVFGEVAFFTEIPQIESVHSLTVAKVLTIPRSAYQNVANSFPIGARTVLENLSEFADQMVSNLFKGRDTSKMLDAVPAGVTYKWASEEMAHAHDGPPNLSMTSTMASQYMEDDSISARQEQALGNLLRVRTLVQQHLAKADEEKTTDFLYAASKGNNTKVRQMLRQGFGVDTSDYDGRTGLMLASAGGHMDVLASLLAAGADPSLQDNLGGSALMEACKNGHDSLVTKLREAGAELGLESIDAASQLCTLVFKCDLPLLRRFLKAGIPVDSGDYDERAALHIAACESNLAVVKLLVNEGGANVWVRDRWGKTACDEARRVGATAVAEYLAGKMAERPEFGPHS